MTGRPNFMDRVVKPLFVMVGTVVVLVSVGYGLFSLKPSSSHSATPHATVTKNGIAVMPEVIVLNASSTAGLARKRAEELKLQNWTISTIGNWSGPKLTMSTVYYPQGNLAAAKKLAKTFGGVVAHADSTMSTNSLTYVIIK